MRLISADFIRNTIFFYLQNLRSVELNDMHLDYFHPHVFEGVEDSLLNVVISQCQLHDFPFDVLRNLTALQNLYLRDTDVSRLGEDSFIGLPALKLLDLRNNMISIVGNSTFKGLKQLRSLYLSGNPIAIVEGIYRLRNIERIELSGTSLRELNYRSFGIHLKLYHLKLERSLLTYLFPDALSLDSTKDGAIQSQKDGRIICDVHSPSTIKFKGLRSLGLDYNRIILQAGNFRFFPNLTVLSLRENGIHQCIHVRFTDFQN